MLDRKYPHFAGMKYDFELWKIPTEGVIEVTNSNIDYIVDCLAVILDKGFSTAKQQFDEIYIPQYFNFRQVIKYAISNNNTRVLKRIFAITRGYAKKNTHLNTFKLSSITVTELYKAYKNKLSQKLMRS